MRSQSALDSGYASASQKGWCRNTKVQRTCGWSASTRVTHASCSACSSGLPTSGPSTAAPGKISLFSTRNSTSL